MELLEIEKELAGANGEAAMIKYDNELVALAARAKAAMDHGVAPDEYKKIENLQDAITLCRKLLRLQRQA